MRPAVTCFCHITKKMDRAEVLLTVIQTLAVKHGFECVGTEDERRELALMGPEERFQALQIEFIGLSYRLETQRIELHETKEKLKAATEKLDERNSMHSETSRAEFRESVIADFKRSHATQAIEMQAALERDRQKLKSAINSELMAFVPKQQAALMDDLLLAAGANPKDSSVYTRLHGLLSAHREQHMLYPTSEVEAMVSKIKRFVAENKQHFVRVNPTPFKLRLPWEITTAGVKRRHPVDKVWDRALDDLDSRCQSIKKPHSV